MCGRTSRAVHIPSYLNPPGPGHHAQISHPLVWGIHADIKSRSLDQYIVKVRELFAGHGLTLHAFRTIHVVRYIFDLFGVSPAGR